MIKSFRTILVTASAAFTALALSACGQKGDLYLPPGQAALPTTAAPAPLPPASMATPQNSMPRQP